jgi:hypothetical protein
MSELRSAIEALRSESLAELPDARVEEDFAELHRAAELLQAELLRRLADIDRRRLFERTGHLSAVAWLAAAFKVAWGTAREQVRMARALREMPHTRRALDAGELSLSAARVLVTTRDADPEAFGQCESELVEAARIHSMGDLGRVAAYWRQAAERHQGLEGEEKLRDRRRLHASVTFLGMVRLDADLDPETGEAVMAALRAVVDAESRSPREGDDRTPAQQRADAMGVICRQYLDLAGRPLVAGERPHITVTVGAEVLEEGSNGPRPVDDGHGALEGGSGEHPGTGPGAGGISALGPVGLAGGGVCELDHVGPVDPETARRLACDASVMRVVMSAASEPLDIGRRTPVIPPGMRRAVIIRDRHCRFPDCDRPHTWCDAHHLVHWADGGPTALPNLLLLCRRHHRMVHQRGGFRLELVDGRPVFRRPDGSVLQDRGPP